MIRLGLSSRYTQRLLYSNLSSVACRQFQHGYWCTTKIHSTTVLAALKPVKTRRRLDGKLSLRCSSTVTGSGRQVTVLNKRTDDEGNEMQIVITSRAAKRLSEIMVKNQNDKLALRLTVQSGGCHGFSYALQLTDQVDENDDTVFELDGAKVITDESSLELLTGSKLDYTMELIGSQFKIVDNPRATSSCGCGTSFDIKF